MHASVRTSAAQGSRPGDPSGNQGTLSSRLTTRLEASTLHSSQHGHGAPAYSSF